ncbi:HAD hydrolase family protein [Phyllobacterium sophorae]|uniref:Sucrose-6-phosphate hydrolase n=1 Tax=Phyllobacterium sophorae TaxID=1520277 RepID=A0A2P7B3N9_9HYPH|nr:HAD hydrolase family protein [Phyllobacterium sophorae]PSH61077.1 sucrose-6-phosphate hydrolase [Phyllobacterium sophorae]
MAKPYATEIQSLGATFEWAKQEEIKELKSAVRTAGLFPLQAIGSGGSLTAAHAIIGLHQKYTGRIATVSTPLDVATDPLSGVSHWLLSAGGGNVDINAAAKALLSREPRQLAVMCGRKDSPLSDLCRQHPFADLLIFPPPAGKDGFLATNSLLGFVSLLARAYALEFGAEEDWNSVVVVVERLLSDQAPAIASWRAQTENLWSRGTTLVIHGPTTRVGAIDLESKFTEAALGNLQLADYRNFAHGRHHWLAKRGELSGVLALVSDQDRVLAEKTLKLIPADVPTAVIDLGGPPVAAMLTSLIAALRITEWAGVARGIDPGRPGVPDFGRKLYNLPLPRPKKSGFAVRLTPRDEAAIARKAGNPPSNMNVQELSRWMDALGAYRQRLLQRRFSAVVFDYDGTLVDTRHRFDLARKDIAEELVRILRSGGRVAIATGRGSSVRKDLRAILPEEYWNKIWMGYYNGAEIAPLSDPNVPDASAACCSQLSTLAKALREHPELAEFAEQTDRQFQITLQSKRMMAEDRLWDIAHQVILATGSAAVKVTRSSHSVDIVAAGVSKANVINRIKEELGAAPILTIGDRGRWPGNDYELLRGEDTLSVDETSVDPDSCWNLADTGQRGVEATLEYLRFLEIEDGALAFRKGAFK